MQIDGENIPRCVVPMLYPWDGAHHRSRGYSGTLIEDLAQTVEESRTRVGVEDSFWLAYTLHQDAVVGCSRDRETAKAQAVAKGVPEPVMRCVAVS